MFDLYFVPTRQCQLAITWAEAQRIANHYRKQGMRVHVCKLNEFVHVLWPAP
jgi:hypothetical protein